MTMQSQQKFICKTFAGEDSKTEKKGNRNEAYLHLHLFPEKGLFFSGLFGLWEAIWHFQAPVILCLTFSGVSYFLWWAITYKTEYLSLTWKCKVVLSKYALFSCASLLVYPLINLCSFSVTCFWRPGEVIWFLYKMPLYWTASRASNKSDQSLCKNDGCGHLTRIRVI